VEKMAGRPPEYKNRTIFTTSVELEIYEKFKEIARREGKPVNRLLQELMLDYIKNHGEGNPNFKLEKWVENPRFVALPTLGEAFTFEKAVKMAKEDFSTWCEIYRRADALRSVMEDVRRTLNIDFNKIYQSHT
jgi:hypothetical protein